MQPFIYSPSELSYLLAGRDESPAEFARETLGLTRLAEGDAGVLTGAQSLVASGRAAVVGDTIEIGDEARLIGFLLGTSPRWVRVSIQTDAPDEGVSSVAMAFAGSERESPSLAIRVLPLGNLEIAILDPAASVVSAAEALVRGYLGRYEIVTVAVQHRTESFSGELGASRPVDEDLRIVYRQRVPGHDRLAHPEVEAVTEEEFFTQLEALFGAGEPVQ